MSKRRSKCQDRLTQPQTACRRDSHPENTRKKKRLPDRVGRTSRLPSRDLRIPHGTSNFKLGTFLCVCLSGFRHLLFQFDTFGCYHFFWRLHTRRTFLSLEASVTEFNHCRWILHLLPDCSRLSRRSRSNSFWRHQTLRRALRSRA